MNTESRPADLYYAFMFGYRHRCGGKPLDPKFTKHDSAEIQKAYADGWQAAQVNMNAASKWAQENYGYEPSILRLAEFEKDAEQADTDAATIAAVRAVDEHVRAQKPAEPAEPVRTIATPAALLSRRQPQGMTGPRQTREPDTYNRKAVTPVQDPEVRAKAILFLNQKHSGIHLTPAEVDMVVEMLLGKACKESAERMNISAETVRARRKRIYRKLDAAGNGQLQSKFMQFMLTQTTTPTPETQTA